MRPFIDAGPRATRAMRPVRLALTALFLCGGTASARPAGYDGIVCDPNGTDVCTWNGLLDRWTCDVSAIGETGEAQAWMVFGDSSDRSSDCSNICDGRLYCAFGVQNGEKFYCDITEGTAPEFAEGWLLGHTGKDTLSFWYEEPVDQAPNLKCGMMNHRIDGFPLVVGKIAGNGDNDVIHGSWEGASDYLDKLYGDAGDDFIYGHGGDDELTGNAGDDDMHGGEDDDIMYGNDDDDNMSGGPGGDIMYGNNNADQMCGDDGDDFLYGGAHVDVLWGDGDNDEAYGGDGLDACNADVESSCVHSAAENRPLTCPVDVLPY